MKNLQEIQVKQQQQKQELALKLAMQAEWRKQNGKRALNEEPAPSNDHHRLVEGEENEQPVVMYSSEDEAGSEPSDSEPAMSDGESLIEVRNVRELKLDQTDDECGRAGTSGLSGAKLEQEREQEADRQRRMAESSQSLQLIATQAAAFMTAALAAQQLMQNAAASFGLDPASLSTLALLSNSAGSGALGAPGQHLQTGAGQSPEQLLAAAMAASSLLAPGLGAAGAAASAANHLVPEDLTVNGQQQHQQHHQQQVSMAASMLAAGHSAGLYGPPGQTAGEGGSRPNGLDATSFQQANNFNKQLVAAVQSHLAASQQDQAEQLGQQPANQHQHPRQHPRLSQAGAAHSLIAHQRADRHLSSSLLVSPAGPRAAQSQSGPAEWAGAGHQNESGAAPNNSNSNSGLANSRQHPYQRPHHHHHHLIGGNHHHTSIQTQQQLLATKGFNPMAVLPGSGQQTETLTPTHLRKAKLMFFYLRYPNSSTLKECFRDVRFNKNNMAQLVKWFSNFREFYYIQMEKFAREAVNDHERIQCKEDIVVNEDHELINVLNNHYNKNRHIALPDVFRQVVEETLRHFFDAIHQRRDQEQSWKKAIYKSIARLDQEVPEVFKTDAFNELLE